MDSIAAAATALHTQSRQAVTSLPAEVPQPCDPWG